MELLLNFAEEHGVQSLGWGISLFLGWKFFTKWDGNIVKLTDNVTELTTIVRVQQEQLHNTQEDVREIKAKLSNEPIVKYKTP